MAARATTAAPRTAPTATGSSRPSRPPSSPPQRPLGRRWQPQGGCPVLGRHRQQRLGGRGHSQDQHPLGVVAVQGSCSASRSSGSHRSTSTSSPPQPKPGQVGRVTYTVQHPVQQCPRGQPRSWSRATSPSTPLATELACTSSPPARPWPAAKSTAPARPNVTRPATPGRAWAAAGPGPSTAGSTEAG
jgi:hypothetical protein